MRLRVGAWTDAGRRRSDNQDYILYRITTEEPDAEHDTSLFVIADGVGGMSGGATASKLAATTLAQQLPRTISTDINDALVEAIEAANTAVYQRAISDPEVAGMGTTIVAIIVRDGVYLAANVGDSRAYLLRNGEAHQITQDHSLVGEAQRRGEITAAEAAVSPYRHLITRSIGGTPDIEVDLFGPERLRPGDRLLLCTDGLTEVVDPPEIAALGSEHDPERAAHDLVDEANRRGGPDNVSVLIIEAVGDES